MTITNDINAAAPDACDGAAEAALPSLLKKRAVLRSPWADRVGTRSAVSASVAEAGVTAGVARTSAQPSWRCSTSGPCTATK